MNDSLDKWLAHVMLFPKSLSASKSDKYYRSYTRYSSAHKSSADKSLVIFSGRHKCLPLTNFPFAHERFLRQVASPRHALSKEPIRIKIG